MIGDSWKLGIALRKVFCVIWAIVILFNAILHGHKAGPTLRRIRQLPKAPKWKGGPKNFRKEGVVGTKKNKKK